jgi:hypothetical protein
MAKCSLEDNLNFWRNYEKSKDKIFIDFNKNPKMEAKFLELVETIKKRSLT